MLCVVFLSCVAQARAGGSVHVGCGGYAAGGYGYSHYCAHRYYSPIGYGGYYYGYPIVYDDGSLYTIYSPYPATAFDNSAVPPSPPAKAATPTPAPQTAQKQTINQIPYGFDIGTKLIKSPWSNFVINGANKAPEQVVYDANTGQAFRIPSPP